MHIFTFFTDFKKFIYFCTNNCKNGKHCRIKLTHYIMQNKATSKQISTNQDCLKTVGFFFISHGLGY